jgi:hypothetical protein
MIRTLFLALALALAASTGALAQLYKSVDKDGRVTYSDQPPAAQESKQLNVRTGQSAPQQSALERDKALEKSRAEARDKAKAANEAMQKAQLDEEACNRAKVQYRTLTDGGRFATIDAKGERTYLEDKQIEEQKSKAREAMDKHCKGS